MKKILTYFFAAIMFLSGIMHIISPEAYDAMIPSFIPSFLANILAALAELAIGILLVIPHYRKWGGLAFTALMVAFLPIHIWDVVRDDPVMGSTGAALIRLAIQFVLIWAGWWISRGEKG
jgi:uncharacterized membrane protein